MSEDRHELTDKNLPDEVRSIKKAFEVLLLAIEAEGIESAIEIADRVIDRLDRVIERMKAGYVQRILDRKFQPFSEDKRKFSEFRSAGKDRPSDQFIDIVSRLERHISFVDREMQILNPQPPIAVEWFKKRWKKLALVVVVVSAVVSLVVGVRDFLNRGKGLMGEYYNGPNFKKLMTRRRDLTINFELHGKGPVRRLGAENFSVRWTGFVRIPDDGSYEFDTRSDDGVRLWIDDAQVIDNWTVHREALDRTTLDLKAGLHAIRLEWFQRRGPATMQLYWRTATDPSPRIVEPDFLVPPSS